ncbi:MAG: TolC family protein [Planctomycetaceae bacterium]|nr:TolC family protein [Planctomycetaceae bacterium]
MKKSRLGVRPVVILSMLALAGMGGCDFTNPSAEDDRGRMADTALDIFHDAEPLPAPLTPEAAVAYGLRHNFEIRAASIEIAYQEESRQGMRLRMLPRLQAQVGLDSRNREDVSSSTSASTGRESLESSYSRDREQKAVELAAVWNLLDFGTGYLRSRQTGEKLLQSREQVRRLRQQTALEILSAYYRACAAQRNAGEAGELMEELEAQLARIRSAKERRVLSELDATRRELAVLAGVVEAERWAQSGETAMRDLARVLGCRDTAMSLDDGPAPPSCLTSLQTESMDALHVRALGHRPELYQSDAQARISLDDARLAILQMAPNANLTLAFHYNDDSHLMWNDWLATGLRVSWNLLSLPSRISERKAAVLQHDALREKNLAMSVAVLAQTGLAMADYRQTTALHARLASRAETRRSLVDSLEKAARDGQVRPSEIIQERIRLLNEEAAVRLKQADMNIALARIANAVGMDVDDDGNYIP